MFPQCAYTRRRLVILILFVTYILTCASCTLPVGFDQSDFLTCCKFAEGDSRVLMMKMSRDRTKLFSKTPEAKSVALDPAWDEEMKFCYTLLNYARLASPGSGAKVVMPQWEMEYALAEVIMQRIVKNFMA